MMKRTLFLMAILLLAVSFPLSAQISKGDPTATTIKTGNRPVKGDFGVFLGGGFLMEQNQFFWLPVMDFKYFVTDHIELRAGIDVYRDFSRNKGKVITATNPELQTYNRQTTNVDGFFNFVPGFAYHFSNLNILDVYVGAEIPLGIENWRRVNNYEGENIPPSVSEPISIQAWNPFVIGANAIVGVQAFIGNLPLAIGLEYGIGAKAYLGSKVKYITEDTDGNRSVYFKNFESDTEKWSRLSSTGGYVDHIIRLTVSYYFN